MYDEEIEDVKQKRLKELQKQQLEHLETIAKQYMSKEAIERYSNLKVGHPELATKVITILAQAIQSHDLREKIDDIKFKDLLRQIQPSKDKFRILK